jgi:SAM-dependent methyltransferase
MHVQSRRDWASFEPAAIPTKTQLPQLERWLDSLVERPAERPARVLDIGCGAGSVMRRLVARGFAAVGIDINPVAIAALKRELGATAELYERDVAGAAGFELDPASFDSAVCQLVASVVGDANDRAQLISNTSRALRPGGALFISFSGLSADLNAEYAELYARDAQATGEYGSYFSRDAAGRVLYRTHHFSRADIEPLLGAHGFVSIAIEEQLEASSRRPEQRARFYYATCRRER